MSFKDVGYTHGADVINHSGSKQRPVVPMLLQGFHLVTSSAAPLRS